MESLVKTELAFAAMAKNQDTRSAFLRYLSDETVMFLDGKVIVGKKNWEERKPDSTLLIWEPVFADVSASGDFGYTTGPSEYFPTRKSGEKVFYGSYVTMWKKEKNGEWKMALDIGVYPQPKPLSKKLNTPPQLMNPSNLNTRDLNAEILQKEKLFVQLISDTGKLNHSNFISEQCLFLRSGMEPVTEKATIKGIVTKELGKNNYKPLEASVSSAGDMGYVYGEVKSKDPKSPAISYYLRVYKVETGKDWKIVLDAIH